MSDYDAVIIGSGVGGLTCGCLLAKEGKRVLIVEQHSIPGGFCTSYRRKGFLFDVPCIIGGLRKGDPIQQLLDYIDVYKKVDFLEIPKLAKIVGPDIEIEWYLDSYKLEQEFISKFPADREDLQKLFMEIRLIWDEIIRAHYKPTILQMIMYPFRFPRLVKYEKFTVTNFLDKFIKNKKIKDLFAKESVTLALSPDELSLFLYIGYIMGYATGGAFYPKGGFQVLSDAFAESFKTLGGEFLFKRCVKHIIIDNKQAKGIELEGGEKITADVVISNGDTKNTYLNMIGKEQLTNKFYQKIKSSEDSFSGVVVKLAVKKKFPDWEDYAWIFNFNNYDSLKRMVANASNGDLDLNDFCFSIDTAALKDHETNDSGISIINITMLPVSYDYNNKWNNTDKREYKNLKENIAEEMIKAAEKFIPDLSNLIVAKDISTPITYERYTSATKGGWYDLALTPMQSCSNRIGPDTPIKSFYTTGGKSTPGPGLNAAIPAGLYTADTILNGKLTKGLCYIDPAIIKYDK